MWRSFSRHIDFFFFNDWLVFESKPFPKSGNFLKSRPRPEPRLGGLPNTPCDPATAARWLCGRRRRRKEPNQILGQCHTQWRSGPLVFVGCCWKEKETKKKKKNRSERLLRRTAPLANPLQFCSSWRSGGRKNELWNFITPGPPLMQLTSYSEPGYLDKQHNEKDCLFLGKTAQATTMNTRWRWITSIMGSCVLDTLSLRGPDERPESNPCENSSVTTIFGKVCIEK